MATIKFLIVGSTLHSDSPGDLDLLGVMPRSAFRKEFGVSWRELSEEIKQGSPTSDLYYAKCKGATLILSQLFDKRRIDFKLVPDNMPYGHRQEISLDDLKTID